ncbi:MAG: arginase family protein [Gaiella sp.]|nr:arginase family protein [Gaiella sp.]
MFDWMRAEGMRWHTAYEVMERGIAAVVDDVVAAARDFPDHVYLTVDVDSLDPAFAPGTGTPEPGGLSSRELLYAIRRIAHELPLAGMEVVEVSPPYDPAGITALVASRCILEAVSGIALRRAGRAAAPELSIQVT